MLLTVKKQIDETVELKTPCYYKDMFGHTYITESGRLVAVKPSMVYVWDSSYGHVFSGEIERILRESTPCEKHEFEKAYAEAISAITIAAGAVEINS